MNEPSIAAQLRQIRAARGWSQQELARVLGVSYPTINAWENERSVPYPRHVKAIADLLNRPGQQRQLVLIVEDDPNAATILADYVALALPGWQSLTVGDGYEAILQLGLRQPAIVLLDIMMPDIDGLEVMARLQAMPELSSTRVIFVTAATDEDLLARARASAALGVVQKPVHRRELIDLLTRAAEAP